MTRATISTELGDIEVDLYTQAAPKATELVNRAAVRGVLLSTDGPDHNVIKIKPPMVFSDADADRLVATVDAVLTELAS